MNAGSRLQIAMCALVLVAGNHTLTGRALSQQLPTTFCSTPEFHQFDFWIGDWDAFSVDKPSKPEARLRVERILGGCVLREDYQGVDGHKGQSFSIYDASKGSWHQTWVTNRGELLLLDGSFRNNEMVLSGADLEHGKIRKIRGVWKPERDGVRETAVRSVDGGRSWEPWFDLIFRPHHP